MKSNYVFGKSELTRSQRFIEQYKRVLDAGPEFFNPDTEMLSVEDYNEADCRVLFVFPSPVEVKEVSSTKPALNDIVKSICNQPRTLEQNAVPQKHNLPKYPFPKEDHARGPLKVFCDFAYMPGQADIKLYDKHKMPYALGQITHLDASHFDIIGFSISVLSDNLGAPQIIQSFENCDTPIPLTWSERKDLPLNDCPFIFGGGITCAVGDIMYGDLGDGRQAFLDCMYLGAGERLDLVFERFIQQDKTKSVQDFMDELFDLYFMYQPQAYKVVFNDKNQIIENTKINPKAQDAVAPFYPLEMEDNLGIGRTIINGRGANVGTVQTQVSEGLFLKGTRVRTNKGLVKIEDVLGTYQKYESPVQGLSVDTTSGEHQVIRKFSHGLRKARKYTTRHGYSISISDDHPVEKYLFPKGFEWVEAGKLNIGDFLTLKKGSSVWGNYPISIVQAEFLGRIVGDGTYNGRTKNYALYCSLGEYDYCKDLCIRAGVQFRESKRKSVWQFSFNADEKTISRLCLTKPYEVKEGQQLGIKYIPDCVWSLDESCTKAFLKGFHDADGCSSAQPNSKGGVYKELSKVTFDSAYEHIIDCIQQLLLSCGVPSKKHYYLKHRVADKELGFHDKDGNHWCLNVSSEYFEELNSWGLNKLCKCVGTPSKEHVPFSYKEARELGSKIKDTVDRSHYYTTLKGNGRSLTRAVCLKHGFEIPDGSYFFDDIVSIEEVEDYGYDLSVTKDIEKLIANGFSIHNCSAAGACNFCAEGNYCLPRGSMIKTPYGYNYIEDFKIGDKVLVNNEVHEVIDTVVSGVKKILRIHLETGEVLRVANTHLMQVPSGEFVRAFNLKIGDALVHESSAMNDWYIEQFKKEFLSMYDAAQEHCDPKEAFRLFKLANMFGVALHYYEDAQYVIPFDRDSENRIEIIRNGSLSDLTSLRNVPVLISSIEEDGEEQTYDINVEGSHAYSLQGYVSHNTGGWTEKPREQILKEIREAKKYTFGDKFKPYSFNCNYLTDYKGMLYEFMRVYPKVSFINMRMNELGEDPDAMRMMKLIGSNRISFPLEGLSPRIQNNLLNKCLSEEALRTALGWCVHGGMADIKVGAIFTSFEEDQDFQWICDLVDGFNNQVKEEGGSFNFRLKATPLIHYPLTGLEFIERRSAKKSYAGEHWLTDEWYEKFREHRVFFKVNGFRYSTFMEQSIVDLGRSATPWLYHILSTQQDTKIYSLRSVASPENIQSLKDIVNYDYFFNDRDPDNYIGVCHRIRIDLQGSYMPRARRMLQHKKEGNIFANEPDIRCLKTSKDAKTKCYQKTAAKMPLKIYTDAKILDGKIQGKDPHLLLGCERCPSNEYRMARLARPIVASKSSDDIMAAHKMRKAVKIRFVLKRNAEYSVLSPNNTAHTFGAKLLLASPSLVDHFHSSSGHNFFWQSESDCPYYIDGYQVVDTIWTSDVLQEIKDLVPVVNSQMKSLQIVRVSEEFIDDGVKVSDYNVFRFESSLPMEMFEASRLSYHGEVKVKKDVQTEIIQDKNLLPPVFRSKGKVVGYFICESRYNPYFYLQGFLNARKIATNKIVDSTKITCVMNCRSNVNTCKCGKERVLNSLITGKDLPFGPKCLVGALLAMEFKK